jgi:hypothetical protein
VPPLDEELEEELDDELDEELEDELDDEDELDEPELLLDELDDALSDTPPAQAASIPVAAINAITPNFCDFNILCSLDATSNKTALLVSICNFADKTVKRRRLL